MRTIGFLLAAAALGACEPSNVCHTFCEVQVDCYNTGDDPDGAVDRCYAPYANLLADPVTRDDIREECRDELESFDCSI